MTTVGEGCFAGTGKNEEEETALGEENRETNREV